MNDSNETQCYLVQLQIDNYLDGDLSASQQESFTSHVQSCAECAAEFRYAQTIHDGLVDLPLMDCSDDLVDSILTKAQQQAPLSNEPSSGIADLLAWLASAPLFIRYGAPAMVVAALAIGFLPIEESENFEVSVVANTPMPETISAMPVEYSPEEVMQALQELNLAIQYLNQVSERTETMIGGRFLMTPLRDNLNASFERIRDREIDPLSNDPI